MHAPRDSKATPKNISVHSPDKAGSVRISILEEKRRRREPLPNLSLYKWRDELPDAEGDAELVRLAKAGDKKAAEQLVKNYHRLVRSYAGRRRIGHSFRKGEKEFTNEGFDDLMGRGFLALWQAVQSYDESLRVPFSEYAKRCIGGQMSDESKTFMKGGLVCETRVDPWLFSHPKATSHEMVAAFARKGKSIDVWEAEQQIRAFKARHSFTKYRDEYLEPKPKSTRRPTMAAQENDSGA